MHIIFAMQIYLSFSKEHENYSTSYVLRPSVNHDQHDWIHRVVVSDRFQLHVAKVIQA